MLKKNLQTTVRDWITAKRLILSDKHIIKRETFCLTAKLHEGSLISLLMNPKSKTMFLSINSLDNATSKEKILEIEFSHELKLLESLSTKLDEHSVTLDYIFTGYIQHIRSGNYKTLYNNKRIPEISSIQFDATQLVTIDVTEPEAFADAFMISLDKAVDRLAHT